MSMTAIPPEVAAAIEAGGEELLCELRALEALTQVRLTQGCVFDRAKPSGSVAQKRGVICKITCCGGQLDVKCNDKNRR